MALGGDELGLVGLTRAQSKEYNKDKADSKEAHMRTGERQIGSGMGWSSFIGLVDDAYRIFQF